MANAEGVVEYKGYKIKLTQDFRFQVTGPLLEHDDICDSVALSKAMIDQTIKAIAKQKTVTIDVITESGKAFVITGINRHTCRLITTPPLKDDYEYDDRQFYPNVAQLKPLLEKWRRLKRECVRAEKTIKLFQIKIYRGYVSRAAEDYPKAINELVAEYNKKKATAEALGKPKEKPADDKAKRDSGSEQLPK